MSTERRLTAEMREALKAATLTSRLMLSDALHDLDVADARIEALESGIANELEDIRLDGQALRKKNHELCAKLAACSAQNLRWEGEANELHADLIAAQARREALLPLAQFGMEMRDTIRDDIDSFVYCEECDHRNYNFEEQRLRGIAEKHGLCKVTKNYQDEKYISLTVEWPNDGTALAAAAAATYTAEVRAQARRETLEEVQENLQYATDEAEIAGVMQRMAAQSKEENKG